MPPPAPDAAGSAYPKAWYAAGRVVVVCLDCGRHFAYDTLQMRMGEPLEQHHGGMPDRAMQG